MTLPADEPSQAPRPTPVRSLMQAEPAPPPEVPAEPPPRIVESEAERWTVREAGATRSGSGVDRGAPLLLVHFDRVEAPEVAPREGLTVATSLDELHDEDLIELLRRSRPVGTPETRPS